MLLGLELQAVKLEICYLHFLVGQKRLIQLKEKELELRAQEAQQDAQQDQAENMLDRMRIEQQAQLARERIASTEDIANMRAQIALQRTANRGGN